MATIEIEAETLTNYTVYGTDPTYSTARSTSFGFRSSSLPIVGQNFGSPNYSCNRFLLKFDCGSLPAGSTINQVNLKMACDGDGVSTDEFDIEIVKQDWSGQDPPTSSNREAIYDNCLSGTLDDNIWKNSEDISLNTYYSSGNLDTDWINKGGITYYSLISSRDISATTPTAGEFMSMDVTTKRPLLVIDYTERVTYEPVIIGGCQSITGINKIN